MPSTGELLYPQRSWDEAAWRLPDGAATGIRAYRGFRFDQRSLRGDRPVPSPRVSVVLLCGGPGEGIEVALEPWAAYTLFGGPRNDRLPVPWFTTSTLDGRRLTQADLGAETLVAFFSPTCEPCEEKIPGFLDFAGEFPGGRARVLAVVVGDPAEANWRVEDFFDVARVVVEPAEGAVSTAFGVRGFPSVLITGPGPDGVPVVTTDDVRLTAPATA